MRASQPRATSPCSVTSAPREPMAPTVVWKYPPSPFGCARSLASTLFFVRSNQAMVADSFPSVDSNFEPTSYCLALSGFSGAPRQSVVAPLVAPKFSE